MRIPLPPGHTAQSIADTCGVNVVTVHRALNLLSCSDELVIDIHFATHGEIPCWALKPKIWREGQVPPVPDQFKSPEAA